MHDAIIKQLPLQSIRLDQRAQPRVKIDQQVVDEYAGNIEEGAVFPPITVVHDGAWYWLADGFHRYQAHQQLGEDTIRAEVREGTIKDAILHSVSANAAHGLRRSSQDKRRAVRILLEDSEWQKWSESEIARRCGVSRPLVADVRKELETGGHLAEKQDGAVKFTRRGRSHAMKVENIGGKTKKPSASTDLPDSDTTSALPTAAESIAGLHQIYASFSVLPRATRMARRIKKRGVEFSAKQAREISQWFENLAHILDEDAVYRRVFGKGEDFPDIPPELDRRTKRNDGAVADR